LQVGIIMGSDSDLPTMKAAEDVLKEFGVACELSIVSAHRTPERMMDYARSAHKRGLQVRLPGSSWALSCISGPMGVISTVSA
jgi:phosphoribosylaminoimidazole carboxylase PurE protein